MIVVLIIAGSALLGLMIGLLFRIRAIALLAPFLALFAAVVLHAHRYGFVDGVMVVVGCLVASQAAYIAGAFLIARSSAAASTHDHSADEPSEEREQHVRRQDEGGDPPPSRSVSPRT